MFIQIKNLTKKFKNNLAVNNINFSIEKNNVLGLLGPNGCGKTTTIGKLGKIFKDKGKKIVFGAADTFRAAAIDQLELWSKKISVDIVKSDITRYSRKKNKDCKVRFRTSF